ncbi:unnamed protein product [Brachionus calyciflorus]|uniref:Uncharacterized protein n=1 Tax=Brachionus calyciflorus TaxID=104777 RepID=A0A814CAU8_9BILA|nr:unnamed protein product [Brachionus calyciflorus]
MQCIAVQGVDEPSEFHSEFRKKYQDRIIPFDKIVDIRCENDDFNEVNDAYNSDDAQSSDDYSESENGGDFGEFSVLESQFYEYDTESKSEHQSFTNLEQETVESTNIMSISSNSKNELEYENKNLVTSFKRIIETGYSRNLKKFQKTNEIQLINIRQTLY